MVKKLSICMVISLFSLTLATPAFCYDPVTKLGRGLCNILTSPLELPAQSSKANNSDGPFAGATVGVLKGLQMTVTRAVVGVYEVATFMLPSQKNSEPILKDPEYFFETSNF
ncbi:MAG: hypothetical protein A3I73_02680 [Omnitrophica bacterium RIFCSPLOWO2_02_FULL_45_16]|nr:MAG: hypothetical protein A3C51_00335 [Omnitrophica bacterium RIFCSPHIGHO2_02_FULL_46_20]OGW94017.1 MAG: hypothetical protein A3G36_04760 [Omnitrophica bacterium RIFCSPLOWO2_12_FULL_45_13]OGW94204.1 MAG: hypothetical protein A3K16_01410 [Omnitrophica bacterium RIFCSPLOWO2_01_FULL_45_24]OGX00677.1 MAG: hypothetical protein A3I73_02680 [Omnitrophica bacterium RIFCSPLOWO2_02_FULL_45_16]